ncbi:DMT family transporter [Arenimonas sp.]|uniref:DMT family transporter n=1 Tax=Arenimonas sp. TaxID=1872635 RepID=UPI0039E72A24
MPIPLRIQLATLAAMIAFAANSLLCRLALRETPIDPASFTGIRLAAGALALWLLMRPWRRPAIGGSWRTAFALFAYAAAFSYAYRHLSAGTGALLLFGAVQLTMFAGAWRGGERISRAQATGVMVAFIGLLALVLPGIDAPPVSGALLMTLAGIAWGMYSLWGRGVPDPMSATAGNFLRCLPIVVVLCAATASSANYDATGATYAIVSGAIASGVGYAIWYTALRGLSASQAASVQLSVPVIAAIGGVALLGETPSWRLALAGLAVLGGIALALRRSAPA